MKSVPDRKSYSATCILICSFHIRLLCLAADAGYINTD